MSPTRMSAIHLGLAVLLLGAGAWLWLGHARAWDLGRSASVLSYDAAQYALAARELADRGRLRTPFALPIELAAHPSPPWPLALVQPGLVAGEALLFRLAALVGPNASAAPQRFEWLVLVLPVLSFLAIGLAFAFATVRVLEPAPDLMPGACASAGAVVGLAFLLDPEARHAAMGGLTELPFTLGLALAAGAIATGAAARRPLAFGLLLGVTGWFRGNMLWLAPILAAAAAGAAERGERRRVFVLALCGYAIPLAPWWIYKWRAFGTPAWDLAWVSIWDGIRGQTWFSLNHLPALPPAPTGPSAAAEIAAKIARNLAALFLDLTAGPRAAWLGALLIWALGIRAARPLRAAAWAVAAVLGASLVAAAATVPLSRYLLPARALAEAAGVLAMWGLIARAPEGWLSAGGRRLARVVLAVLVLGWGGFQTVRGAATTRAAAHERGVPAAPDLIDLTRRLDHELAAGEPVMSNLGPILAWYAHRPVVHLALTPADIEACRRRLELRHVLLVFRAPERAWPLWDDLVRRPEEAARNPDWNIARARRFETKGGFVVVWLELGPPLTRVAATSEVATRPR